jgi:hypothetical protein
MASKSVTAHSTLGFVAGIPVVPVRGVLGNMTPVFPVKSLSGLSHIRMNLNGQGTISGEDLKQKR